MRQQSLEGNTATPTLKDSDNILRLPNYQTEREEAEAECFHSQTVANLSLSNLSATATLSDIETITNGNTENNHVAIDLDYGPRVGHHGYQQLSQEGQCITESPPPCSKAASVASSTTPQGNADELAAKANTKRLKFAIVLCFVFFAAELAGGLFSGSLALLSDSFHLLSDCVSFSISLMAIKLSRKRSTKDKTYGYHRAEVIGALISVFLIWGLTLDLCSEAIGRLTNPQPVEGKVMLIIAICGVCVNVVLGVSLHHDDLNDTQSHINGNEHGPNHRQNHDQEKDTANKHNINESINGETLAMALRRENHTDQFDLLSDCDDEATIVEKTKGNINIRAATLHVLGDLISSIGVLIASIIILMGGPPAVDPICTFVFSAMVIMTTVGVAKESIGVLMEATPASVDTEALVRDLTRIEGVVGVHALHVWELTPGKVAMSVHIVENPAILLSKPQVRGILPMRCHSCAKRSIVDTARRVAQQHGCGERFCTIQVELEGDSMCEESEGWESNV